MVTILELTQMSENLNNVGSPTPTNESLLAGLPPREIGVGK
mgnify:CR=1 FL=1